MWYFCTVWTSLKHNTALPLFTKKRFVRGEVTHLSAPTRFDWDSSFCACAKAMTLSPSPSATYALQTRMEHLKWRTTQQSITKLLQILSWTTTSLSVFWINHSAFLWSNIGFIHALQSGQWKATCSATYRVSRNPSLRGKYWCNKLMLNLSPSAPCILVSSLVRVKLDMIILGV